MVLPLSKNSKTLNLFVNSHLTDYSYVQSLFDFDIHLINKKQSDESVLMLSLCLHMKLHPTCSGASFQMYPGVATLYKYMCI